MLAHSPHPPSSPAPSFPHQPALPRSPGFPAPENGSSEPVSERGNRPRRACNTRPRVKELPPQPPVTRTPVLKASDDAAAVAAPSTPAYRVITPLVAEPPPAELPRWRLRGMWELSSVLNFLHVFRPMLNIDAEFNAEELEEALIKPNVILADVHMPMLKAIPPIARMALSRATWVTVLCRKLRDWWHWVAEGDVPIVASQGSESENYNALDPATRLVILKSICDIRVEQDDIRNYIESSLKHGFQLSAFRKERIGGDSYGTSFWYEDDDIIGHRLYRETHELSKIEGRKLKSKGLPSPPSFKWETVATSFDEFQEVADKLFSSQNKSEVSLGKKLKINYLPDIEKVFKKKERLLKKQQREAILLDSYLTVNGISAGRSLRDRKPVTYTFDDYDRSINEAIKITKKGPIASEILGKKLIPKPETESNGKLNGMVAEENTFGIIQSPKLEGSQEATSDGYQQTSDDGYKEIAGNGYQETDEEPTELFDRSNRRRKRSQKYLGDFVRDYTEDVDPNFGSDDDIVGEAVYDDDYMANRKLPESSASEEDEEFRLEEEVASDDEEEKDYVASTSEDKEERNPRKRRLLQRCRKKEKLRSVDEHTGPRRSKRVTSSRISYQQCNISDIDSESAEPSKSTTSDSVHDFEVSTSSQDQEQEKQSDEHAEVSDNASDNEMKKISGGNRE